MVNRPSDFKEWHRRQIDDYAKNEYAIFSTYAEVLQRVLQRVCSEHAKLGIVQSRPKAVSSFAEKAVRKWPAIHDPIRQLTDLCGARVITHTQGEIEPICEFIETHFDIEEAEDVGSRLGATEFGYASFHYIVRLRAEALAGVSLPKQLGATEEILETIGTRKAEIQVRTLMQHAWADVMHDRLYKTKVNVPQAWQHLAARQAAILENADNEFSRIVEELDSYLVHYDAYMTPEEMDTEIETLETILENEPVEAKKPAVSLRIARIAAARGDWKTVVDHLGGVAERIAEPAGDFDRAVLVEIGRALCERREPKGRAYLEKVAKPETNGDGESSLDELRAEALALLARSYVGEDGEGERVRELYRKASLCDPDNPYHLVAAVEQEVHAVGSLDGIRLVEPQVEAAIERCTTHAMLEVELPRAYYTTGKAHLLRQRFHEAAEAYSRAVMMSVGVEEIDRERVSIGLLEQSLAEPPAEFEKTGRFLLLGRAGKLWHRARAASLEAGERVSFAGHARETLDQMRAEGVVSDEQIVKAEDEVREAEASAERAHAAAETAETAARDASSEERIVKLRSAEPQDLAPPVIIMAGGNDPAVQERIASYRASLDTAFEGFGGTVIKDGEALQVWCDLLACGVRPNDVRVLGIGGGKTASFEYHLALMMGATVGLLSTSGGAAAELAADASWWPPGQLLVLPEDVMTLRAFVNPPRTTMTENQVDSAARVVHEIHTKEKSRKQADAAMRSWEHTPRDFQESNRQQVIYAEQILRRVGYRVGALDADAEDPDFTPEQIETMAELEHGRWVVERLAMGWTWGEEKDEKKRISPYLVAWDQVPDGIRDYDREAVRNYPRTLRKAGLGVFKIES